MLNSVHVAIGAIAAISIMAMYTGQAVPSGVIEALGLYAVGRQIVKSVKGV